MGHRLSGWGFMQVTSRSPPVFFRYACHWSLCVNLCISAVKSNSVGVWDGIKPNPLKSIDVSAWERVLSERLKIEVVVPSP